MMNLNLAFDPWIPCIVNGQLIYYSIFDVLLKSPEIDCICHPQAPSITFSLHQMLIAVIQAAYRDSLKTNDDVFDLYQKGKFDKKKILDYLEKWRDRFYLFHPTHPIFQDVTLNEQMLIGKHNRPIANIMWNEASGSENTLYSHNTDDAGLSCDLMEVACCLQQFNFWRWDRGRGSAKGHRLNGFCILLEGDNLFQTLTMNLNGYDVDNDKPIPCSKNDKPVWEQNSWQRGTYEGLLDLLTRTSRRILLCPPDESGQISHACIVRDHSIGDFKIGNVDPYLLYPIKRSGKKEDKPLKIISKQSVWSDSYRAIAENAVRGPEHHELVCQNVQKLFSTGFRNHIKNMFVGLYALHYRGHDKAFWLGEHYRLPQIFVQNDNCNGVLRDMLVHIRQRHDNIRGHTKYFLESIGKRPSNFQKRKSLDLVEKISCLYWERARQVFDDFLREDFSGDLGQLERKYKGRIYGIIREIVSMLLRVAIDLSSENSSCLELWANLCAKQLGRDFEQHEIYLPHHQRVWVNFFIRSLFEFKQEGFLHRIAQEEDGNPSDEFLSLLRDGCSNHEFAVAKLIRDCFCSYMRGKTFCQSDGVGFGTSFRNAAKTDSARRQFALLLDCGFNELSDRLVRLVVRLRQEEIGIDWYGLMADLLCWGRRDRLVQQRWAKGFYMAS